MKKTIAVLLLLAALVVSGQLSYAADTVKENDQSTLTSKTVPSATSNVTIGFSTKKGSTASTTDEPKTLSLLPKTGERMSIGFMIIGLLFIVIAVLQKRQLLRQNKKKHT